MTTNEITIYEKTNENSVLYLYCESCKPRGGKQGTLVLSSYDHFCAGCGKDFKETAEPTVSRLTGLFREPCHRCHLVQTYGRDQHNLPLCQGCAMREQAWDDLQAVPAYVERLAS